MGVRRTLFGRRSVATYYDGPSDRLVEATPNRPRFEEHSGHPAGRNCGLLVEAPATNHLTNSSFELGLAGWSTEGGVEAAEGSLAIHGNKGIRVEGSRGSLLHAEVTPIAAGAKIRGTGFFGALSVYCSVGDGDPAGTIRPAAFGVEGDVRGRNLVKDYRFVRMGKGRWHRLVGRFKLLRPGAKYLVGFQLLKRGPVALDAAQFEANNLPWTASSYIPTGKTSVKREVEFFKVEAAQFPAAKGTITLWHRTTNPFHRTGYIFVHGPFENKDRLFIHGAGAVTLGMKNSRWAQKLMDLPKAGDWHLFAVTWDGQKAIQYFDGKEFGQHEGAFEYEGLRKYGGHLLIGSNGGSGDLGAEGIVSDVNVWPEVLSAGQIERIWQEGGPVAATEAVQTAGRAREREEVGRQSHPTSDDRGSEDTKGIPVDYVLSQKGKTSVGIYNADGALCRQLVLGKEQGAGSHQALWDGRDDKGTMLPAGEYEYKGVVNNLGAVWHETVGNTGRSPWGKTCVRGGLFKALDAYKDGVVVTNPLAEGNHGVQRLDKNGQVVWTSEIDPVYAYMTALAADERYVYIAGLIRNERDARGQLFREVIWRLDGETGRIAPWGQKTVIDLNEPRVAPPGRKFFDRYYNGVERYRNPLPGFEVHDLEVHGGKLFVPFFREDSIRIIDVASGKIEGILKGIPKPKGIAVDGRQILVAGESSVVQYDLKGRRVREVIAGLSPYDVEIGRDGRICVNDLGDSQQVKVYAASGKHERTFGLPRGGLVKDGSLERLFLATGIAVDAPGRTVVADFGNGRVVYYDDAGKRVLTVEAPGFGGMDGGVSFIPGSAEMLFMSNIFVFGTRLNCNIVAYRTGARGGKWETVHRWSDVTPVFSQEPLYVRRLPNGRTYLFLLARNPSIFEMKPDGRLEFCGALLHPLDYRVYVLMRPEVKKDADALGLLDKKGLPKCRMTWIDGNRNCRIEANEVRLLESDTRPFYTVNDACVMSDGTIYTKDYLKSTFWRFDLQGFDDAGNPLYDWRAATKLWDLADYPQFQGRRWMLIANEADHEGNMYFSQLKGTGPCLPTEVRLLKFAKDGRFLWNVGRKARGLKDKPGEFVSVICLAGINRGILYVLEYEGRVDLYTTDGLYLTTFLRGTVEDDSPYSNWGENFAGAVVEDEQTGDVFFVINTHNYRLPYFKVKGLDTIRRFSGKVRLTSALRDRLAKVSPDVADSDRQKMTHFYWVGDRGIKIDGVLAEWQGIPGTSATFPDHRSTDHSAKCQAGFDQEHLYVAFSVADPDPARNKCTAPSVLWDGDCFELYISPNIEVHSAWKRGDFIVHIAAAEDRSKPTVGVLHRIGKQWASPPEIISAVRVWPDRKGYDFEARIPLKTVEFQSLKPGQLLRFDWDICYATKEGKVSYKLAWSDVGHRVLYDPDSWSMGRCVVREGQEKDIYLFSGSAATTQAQIRLPESADQYNAALKATCNDEQLLLHFSVADPDPALVTPGANWVGTGDYIEMQIGGKTVYVAAGPAFTTPYLRLGGQATKIGNGRSVVRVDRNKRGYEVEVAIPWRALGGRQDTMRFNWRVGWSDASGGSAFTQRSWLPWGKEWGRLRVLRAR